LIKCIMVILIASDIHAGPRHLATTLSCAEEHGAGAVVLNGDIIPKMIYRGKVDARHIVDLQREYLCGTFLPEIRTFKERHPDVSIYVDLGNDDFWCNRDLLLQAESERVLFLLHNMVQPLAPGIDMVGYMFVPPTPFSIKDAERIDRAGAPFEGDVRLKGIFSVPNGLEERFIDEDETIEDDLKELERRIKQDFVLATHAPPYGLGLDVLYDGRRVGSVAIRDFIDRNADAGRLIAAFSGHVHESFRTSGTSVHEARGRWIVNAGQLEDRLRYSVLT
jgi:Icc-related predicted phosphoesterase